MGRIFILLTFFGLLTACQSYEILPKPVIFDETRRQLSLNFLKTHYGLNQQEPLINPVMIVVHWTTLNDLESAYKVFQDPVKPRFRNDDIHLPDELNSSAHYLVDRDGSIYQLLADSLMARHVVGLNYCALGIKNVGNAEQPLTAAQLGANAYLVEKIVKKHPIKYLIGNYEYPLFQEHPLWKNFSNETVELRSDPGVEFMDKLREEVKKLGLIGPPKPN